MKTVIRLCGKCGRSRRTKAAAIPAIALTAYGRAEDRIRALAAGFQTHVAKPVEPDELAAVILSLLKRYESKAVS